MRLLAFLMVVSLVSCGGRSPNLSPEEKMNAAKRGFAAADLNHDGVISHAEWIKLENGSVATVPDYAKVRFRDQLEFIFKQMDKNHDGKITFKEYISDNFGENRAPYVYH